MKLFYLLWSIGFTNSFILNRAIGIPSKQSANYDNYTVAITIISNAVEVQVVVRCLRNIGVVQVLTRIVGNLRVQA